MSFSTHAINPEQPGASAVQEPDESIQVFSFPDDPGVLLSRKLLQPNQSITIPVSAADDVVVGQNSEGRPQRITGVVALIQAVEK